MTNLFLIAILLPLLLGGRGEKATVESVAEVKPESVSVNAEELEIRETIWYLKGSDVPYTGKAFKLYENGQKQAEGNFKDGKAEGLWTQWYENGQKKSEFIFKNGKRHGLNVEWYKNGQKNMEANFKDGKLDGLEIWWHEDGQKRKEINYKDGKLDGPMNVWHENGQKAVEGKLQGREYGRVIFEVARKRVEAL